ncbi:MAG: DNA mismatch repair protein MutL [Armatimonadetes bacterium CG_4_10_14_3_um_filter_66_18]|nr:DNA mismatch repair endonuclease MutL [Armatimonadota bacterium]OIO91486.1 MAG: hypothetical protein AUJ96_33895 [Armatimonadetes bacterium CG2_30_66_41]PIU88946.1 MAG: DNA mismatch repair protein MutL [Armatimonadetes bacterium CG06_land_8_20_14_3_00_66_21]PIX46618.1 MAG: DNA mismatch repair protein MutL [Armatimonadetes bacterium CG_4_8_14_3_um_filter_66_20]PIY50742.1 MAG: DNA mismatch repair protein MutL [Armatimonadetes bacterium CG_4_10_14_3_um_filter_66_18]PIZ50532.1 MAG: DNA mismatch
MPDRVNVLDASIANKIAAGEVIERPASVVKELVENALDAGAQNIEVDVEAGGKRLLRIQDDGCGMSQRDAVVAFQRHATSKLRCLDDLFRVTTLGFRGEALPSIASVSQVQVTTREAGVPEGTRITLEGGEVTDVSEIGCPPGTTFVVQNLFFNTPARLKFLRTDATELGHISALIARFTLSHSHVSFTLRHNDQELLRHTADSDPLSALVSVYGKDAAQQMLPVDSRNPALTITGFVSKPALTRANRNQQNFFVNKRHVRNRSLSHAVAEAYRGLMGGDRFPLVVLTLELDPEVVDVNVHPTKSEVRFTRESEIHALALRAVRDTLSASQLVPAMGVPQQPPPPSAGHHSAPFQHALDVSTAAGFQPSTASPDLFRRAFEEKAGLRPPESPVPAAPPELMPERPASALNLRPVGTIRNTYILCESEDGLLIVNQHRAHERVLMQREQEQRDGTPMASQQLVVPFTLNLSHREAACLTENLALLGQLGFDLEPFGRDTFLIRAVPLMFASQRYEEALRDFLDELLSTTNTGSLNRREDALRAMLSCRGAIKAGDRLAPQEIDRLLTDLQRTDNPYICPHGQPIIVGISHHELDKKFERT